VIAEGLGDRFEPPRLLAAVGVAIDRALALVVSGPRVDVQLVAPAIVAVGRGYDDGGWRSPAAIDATAEGSGSALDVSRG
jgi:hypothetical protein